MVADSTVETQVIPPEQKGGRPSLVDEALPIIVEAMEEGNSQATAARLAGIHPDTLSRWKKEIIGFADAIERAEAVYIASVRKRLKACKTKWGTDDPKAIELETRRLAEFRQHQVTESQSTSLTVTVSCSLEEMQAVQAMRAASLAALKSGIETGQISDGK